jgi:hypothetical protein
VKKRRERGWKRTRRARDANPTQIHRIKSAIHCIASYHASIISQLLFEQAGSMGVVAGRGWANFCGRLMPMAAREGDVNRSNKTLRVDA